MKSRKLLTLNSSLAGPRYLVFLTCLLISAFNLLATRSSFCNADELTVPSVLTEAKSSAAETSTQTVELQFGGSLCPVCLNAFKTRLLATEGVSSVNIAVEKKNPRSGHPPKVATATVNYSPDKVTRDTLIETIKRNDFQFLTAKEIKKAEKVD